MVFKKNDAIGGNYKLQHLKTFVSKENMFQNVKRYRKVFDAAECRYIYLEIAFYNKLFDEEEWQAKVKGICINTENNKQICEITKDIEVKKNKNIIHFREGWGTPDPGWWKKGVYRWDAYIEEEKVGETTFFVTDGGVVTPTTNPYFNLSSIRMFEGPYEGIPYNDREYLITFNKDKARYVNVEMTMENLLPEEANFPLELQFAFYNDAGQLKASMNYFKNFKDKRKEIIIDSGYGAQKPGFWYEDNYTVDIVFMDQLLAVVPFKVAKENEALTDPDGHNFSTKHEIETV
ncbi:MAG: stage V sporulation protein K, partial [Bacteroidota bacterium]